MTCPPGASPRREVPSVLLPRPVSGLPDTFPPSTHTPFRFLFAKTNSEALEVGKEPELPFQMLSNLSLGRKVACLEIND